MYALKYRKAVKHAQCPADHPHATSQANAPVSTGFGINWYGGPVLNNQAGTVVRPHALPCHQAARTSCGPLLTRLQVYHLQGPAELCRPHSA